MHLQQYLYSEAILTHVPLADKQQIYGLLVETLMGTPLLREHPHITAGQIHQLIAEREQEATTILERGLALPHVRIDDFTGVGMAFALLENPAHLNGADRDPVSLCCLLLVPSEHPTVGLKVTAQLARLMMNGERRQQLLRADTPQDALEVLRPLFQIEDVITAGDIMRAPKYAVYNDTPLRHVTRKIMYHGVEALGVTDHQHRLVGQITCDDLFEFGLPDYFGRLRTVSFIRNFSPFDRYFSGENRALASDVMKQNYATVSRETTLLEIIFLLAVKKYPKIYVVEEDNHLVGLIDRRLVLDRVINF